jgi:hypothetical protein
VGALVAIELREAGPRAFAEACEDRLERECVVVRIREAGRGGAGSSARRRLACLASAVVAAVARPMYRRSFCMDWFSGRFRSEGVA